MGLKYWGKKEGKIKDFWEFPDKLRERARERERGRKIGVERVRLLCQFG